MIAFHDFSHDALDRSRTRRRPGTNDAPDRYPPPPPNVIRELLQTFIFADCRRSYARDNCADLPIDPSPAIRE